MNTIKKKLKIAGAVIVLVLLSLPSAFGAIKTTTNTENIVKQAGFNAVNIDETTIKITFNPGEFEFGSVNTEEGMFATIDLPDYNFNFVKGEAKLPVVRKMVEIPQGANPTITTKSISWQYASLNELGLPSRIVPAQQSVEKIPEPITDFVVNEKYYSSNTFTPEVIAKISDIEEIRSRRFALVEISPIQYNPANGELKLMNSCEITVNLPNSDIISTYEKIKRYSTPSYEQIFETTFANYGFYEKGNLNRNSEGYLFIVYDNFYEEIQPLVDMKESKGFDVTTTKTSDIPGGATKENIKAYIQEAYDEWNIPPAFILLVGDTPQIPTYPGTTGGPTAVDLYYVTVDGSDYFADIYIGRFPGSQESHITAMVEKTVYYEIGNFPSNEWIKKAAFLASTDNWQISEGTHNYVIDTYLNPNGYTCDKLYSHTYGATTQQVRDAINDGRSLVIYSGHGSPGGWADGPPFSQSDVIGLTNENYYPFVCSHACSTNTFNDGECFGETWLRQADKAGLAFWGASTSTYWDEDDILEKSMFKAWWEDNIEFICGMTNQGLLYLYEHYGGGGSTKYYFEGYNVLGDPSVKIWRQDPSQPPETPSTPDGPSEWVIGTDATFKSTTTDPEGEGVYYLFDWGDGTNSGWVGAYNSGETGEASHSWSELGEYQIKVIAKDIHNVQSEWSEPTTATIIVNSPPNKPTIDGPKIILSGREQTYKVTATDPNNHEIYYYIYWGDGDYVNWEGPYKSGETASFKNSWPTGGSYNIIVKAKDFIGDIGSQTSLEITVIKNRNINNILIQKILEHLANQFPIINKILNN